MKVNVLTDRARMCRAPNTPRARQAPIHPPKMFCAKRSVAARLAYTTEGAAVTKAGGSGASPSVTSNGRSGKPSTSTSTNNGSISASPGGSNSGSKVTQSKPHTGAAAGTVHTPTIASGAAPRSRPPVHLDNKPLPPVVAAAAAKAQQGDSWSSGKWLAFGGSVGVVILLTVFRREIAPVMRLFITQINNFTDKSVLGEVGQGNVEALATAAAVGLTLYWSFTEFAASSERMKRMEDLEAQTGEQLQAMSARLESTEQRLDEVAAELAALRQREETAGWAQLLQAEVAAELAALRQPEQGAAGQGLEEGQQQQQQQQHGGAEVQGHSGHNGHNGHTGS